MKNSYIMRIIIITIFSSLFLSCEQLEKLAEKEDKPTVWENFGLLYNIMAEGCLSFETTADISISDPGGPYIVRKATITNRHDCIYPDEVLKVTYRIKKCLQGQVFRSAENDCQGTGDAGNLYGAVKAQWCATNDNSCVKYGGEDPVADPVKSPAAALCAAESIDGYSWEMIGIFSLNHDVFYEKYYPDDVVSLLPGLSHVITDHTWTKLYDYKDNNGDYFAYSNHFNSDGIWESDSRIVTESNYVLCASVTEGI